MVNLRAFPEHKGRTKDKNDDRKQWFRIEFGHPRERSLAFLMNESEQI